MDWAVTARTTLPHVRQTVADRELETWVVMDLSASLDFGTAACEKRDLAVAALAAVTHLTAGGGNRIGVVVSTGEQTVRIPARGGVEHARGMLRRVYAELGEQIGYELRRVDASRPWMMGGALLLVAGIGAGLALGRRLP